MLKTEIKPTKKRTKLAEKILPRTHIHCQRANPQL